MMGLVHVRTASRSGHQERILGLFRSRASSPSTGERASSLPNPIQASALVRVGGIFQDRVVNPVSWCFIRYDGIR
jgi:hypothetical protein